MKSKSSISEENALTVPTQTALFSTGVFSGDEVLETISNKKTEAIESPLCRIGSIFTNSGIYINHVKTGLISLTGLMSSKLGDPLRIAYLDDTGVAADEILALSTEMVPPGICQHFNRIVPDKFNKYGAQMYNKSLICRSTNGLSSIVDLSSALEAANVGSLAVLGHSAKSTDDIHKHPKVLTLHVPNDSDYREHKLLHIGNQTVIDPELFKLKCIAVQTFLNRLQAHQVHVPYVKQISDCLNKDDDNVVEELNKLLKLIKNVTRINNPPEINQAEVIAAMLTNNTTDKLEFNSICTNLTQLIVQDEHAKKGNVYSSQEEPLVATKVDYYTIWVLLDGVLKSEFSTTLTDRQKIIAEAVKEINMGLMSTTIKSKDETQGEVLAHLHYGGDRGWATRNKIFEGLLKKDAAPMSPSTLNRELSMLAESGVLSKMKRNKEKEYSYAVNTLELFEDTVLPKPSSIQDPVYNGKPIDVINPITGETEKI